MEKGARVEVRRYTNRKGNVCEGVFVDGELAHPLNGFVQVRRGLVAHGAHLGDRLGWLYTVILCLAKPVGSERGSLRIELGVLAVLLGKSVSQIRRDLTKLEADPHGYICYKKATGRYCAKAEIVIPKYGKTGG